MQLFLITGRGLLQCSIVTALIQCWRHDIHQQELLYILKCGGAHGVMVIVVGNGHGDTSSNPG